MSAHIDLAWLAEFLRDVHPMRPRLPAVERPSNRVEILIGRTLAMTVHPTAAWRSSSLSNRALLLFGYFATAYVTVLSALLLSAV